jgi:hypothetical protein
MARFRKAHAEFLLLTEAGPEKHQIALWHDTTDGSTCGQILTVDELKGYLFKFPDLSEIAKGGAPVDRLILE